MLTLTESIIIIGIIAIGFIMRLVMIGELLTKSFKTNKEENGGQNSD